MRFVIITGISGAGKSLTVKYLEDLGYFCVDNLPPALIPKFAEFCCQSGGKMVNIAMVVDIRGGELFHDLFPALKILKELKFNYEILFLEASDKVLIKRYKESRRMHPLSPEGRLLKGIKDERKFLNEIKSKSDNIIDTSIITPRQLKEEIENKFLPGKIFHGIIINIISFGFKYGTPIECDLIFDVRFIPNPFYIDSLKKLTGKNEKVKEYVLSFSETSSFIIKLNDMMEFLVPNYIKEGKSHLVIGIGCTGGKHRSVVISKKLYEFLTEKKHRVIIDHRDIDKENRRKNK